MLKDKHDKRTEKREKAKFKTRYLKERREKMKIKTLMIMGFALAVVFIASSAFAVSIIDFRDAAWDGAYGQNSYTVAGTTATVLDPVGGLLYQDNVDGLGILGGEPDEVDREVLRIDFAQAVCGVGISDLFYREEEETIVIEEGQYSLDNGANWFDFVADPSQVPETTNGELYVSFGVSAISALFRSLLDEFSVQYANICDVPPPVPEPASMIAFLLGGLGIAVKRIKK